MGEKMTKWNILLSTTEPINPTGIIKVRQSNIATEVLNVTITENSSLKDLTDLKVYFNTVINKNPVEKRAVVVDGKKGVVNFVLDEDCMQQLGSQTAYFSFKTYDNEQIGATQNFNYVVQSSLLKTLTDGQPFIASVEEIIAIVQDLADGLEPEAAVALLRKVTDLDRIKADLDFTSRELSLRRLVTDKILSSDLSTIRDSDKIQEINLSDKVKQMMAGNTPVNSTPGPNSVTNDKLAFRAVSGARIANDTVAPENLRVLDNEFITPVNKSSIQLGAYINGQGVINTGVNYENWGVTPFIEVLPARELILTSHRLTCFYDSSQQLISYTETTLSTNPVKIYTPDQCKFIRTNVLSPTFNPNAFERFQIINRTDGFTLTPEVKVARQNINNRSVVYNHLGINIVDEENASFIRKIGFDGTNLFSIENMVIGLLRNTGIVDSTSSQDVKQYVTSDFLPVEPNEDYKINFARSYCFYDTEKELVKFVDNGAPKDGRVIFKTPEDAAYIRISVANLSDYTFYDGPNSIVLIKLWESKKLDDSIKIEYGSIINRPEVETDSNWSNKIATFHGDSIVWQDGKAYNGSETVARGYGTILKESLDFKLIENYGASGKSVANGTSNGDGIVNIIKSKNYEEDDLVILAGGTNDFRLNVPLGDINEVEFDNTTFYGALRDSIEYILTEKPAQQLMLMTPLQRDNAGYDVNKVNSVGHKLIDYVNAIKDICKMYSIPCWDAYSISGLTKLNLSLYTIDGLHPNDFGYHRITRSLISFVNSIGGV